MIDPADVMPSTSCTWRGRLRLTLPGNSPQPAHGAGDHPRAGSHAPDGAERQDPHRPGSAADGYTSSATAGSNASTRSWWRMKRSASAIPP